MFPARFTLFAAALLAVLAVEPGLATAQTVTKEQKRAAETHTNAGIKLYNVGRFEDAITEFDKAYQIVPHSTLLFNLGKAHWRNGSNDKALFLFRRYLVTTPADDPDRPTVEKNIKEIEAAIKAREDQQKVKSAAYVPPPVPEIHPNVAVASPAAAADVRQSAEPAEGAESQHIRLIIGAGIALPQLSRASSVSRERLDLDHQTMFSASVGAAYSIPLGLGALDVGLAGSWSPLTYVKMSTAQDGQSSLIGAFASAALRFRVSDALSLGPTVGGGLIWWSGLDAGNPFTGGRAAGTAQMPTVRGGATSAFAVARNVSLGLDVTGTYSMTSGVLGQYIGSMKNFGANLTMAISF